MPTYQYACTECGHAFEQFQSFSDDALTECPECSGRLRKLFNAVGVVFKGSGFYRTDSRAAAGSKSESSPSSSSGSSESSSSSDSGLVGWHRHQDRQQARLERAPRAPPTEPVDDRPAPVPVSPTVTGCSVTGSPVRSAPYAAPSSSDVACWPRC